MVSPTNLMSDVSPIKNFYGLNFCLNATYESERVFNIVILDYQTELALAESLSASIYSLLLSRPSLLTVPLSSHSLPVQPYPAHYLPISCPISLPIVPLLSIVPHCWKFEDTDIIVSGEARRGQDNRQKEGRTEGGGGWDNGLGDGETVPGEK